jgi:hypothetical protein
VKPRFLLLAPLLMALAGAPDGAAQDSPAPAAVVEVEAPAEITGRDALLAWHRMAGTEPDFAALAELDLASRKPPPGQAWDEGEWRWLRVLAGRRMKAEFSEFDLDRAFTVTLGADILGYDRERGGIPLGLDGMHGVPLRDPTAPGRVFSLRFRNADALGVIRVPDGHAAASMLQGARLASLGDWAGHGAVTLTFVFAGVLPQAPEADEVPLSVEILSARVETVAGEVLHVFRRVGTHEAAAAARQAGPPPLRSAALAGVRIGMTGGEARRVALAAYPEPLGFAFYDGLPEDARNGPRRPDCSGGLVADILAFGLPVPPEDSYLGCLAVFTALPGDPLAGRVAEIAEIRFLPGGLTEELRTQVEERYGPPLEELGDDRLIWIGADPEEGGWDWLLELRATFVRVAEGGPRREPGALLALTLRRHLPPSGDGS